MRRAKSAAALQGTTLREWLLKAIEEKLKKANTERLISAVKQSLLYQMREQSSG
jgi:hypothetical protein